MPQQFTFTVFTPTYNRIRTLPRLFESLKSQEFRDFEWLIVDDGSSDGTPDLVQQWLPQASFPMRYIWQENSGKHIAHNRAVEDALGTFFITVDSDDYLLPISLRRFKEHWDTIPEESREEFTGVTALCVDEQGKLIGSRFPADVIDSDLVRIQYRFDVRGDKIGFHRTQHLQDLPFPEIAEPVVPEGVVWDRLSLRFRTRFVNEVLQVKEYLAGGFTRSSRSRPESFAVGHALWNRYVINDYIRWFGFTPMRFIRAAANYSRFAFHAGDSIYTQGSRLTRQSSRALWLLLLPLGYLIFLRDGRRAKARRSRSSVGTTG
ncbi:MAG TPA: glycosyltransferase family 2 protein [Thermoanaerobaculia bacterium]|nr:glycosyltransferase family 2 protein [Thermoanaerobaculia bacterium]